MEVHRGSSSVKFQVGETGEAAAPAPPHDPPHVKGDRAACDTFRIGRGLPLG